MEMKASASLPTRFGNFQAFAFSDNEKEHLALVKGDVKGKENVLVRVHSQCTTGDVFASLKCDCREQLEKALRKIAKAENGALVYLDQEGRGIGLANKIKAYDLQDKGQDTVEANISLGFPPDARNYKAAGKILRALGIKSVLLLTNNPEKRAGLGLNGIKITKCIPLLTKPNKFNRAYLSAKKKKLGHIL